jgi:hypothetical protein
MSRAIAQPCADGSAAWSKPVVVDVCAPWCRTRAGLERLRLDGSEHQGSGVALAPQAKRTLRVVTGEAAEREARRRRQMFAAGPRRGRLL